MAKHGFTWKGPLWVTETHVKYGYDFDYEIADFCDRDVHHSAVPLNDL
jgi:hypothetical protein